MSTGRVYKQAIKRVFREKYHDERIAVYWGRDDKTIHVIASLKHYVHDIAATVISDGYGPIRVSILAVNASEAELAQVLNASGGGG